MMQTSEFRSMGSRIFVALDGSDARVFAASRQVPGWFTRAETIFSRFDPESELSRLNCSHGSVFHASREMIEVLQLAKEFRQRTRGLITPTVLDALINSGYDADFSSILSQQQGGLHEQLLPPDAMDFDLDATAGTVILPRGIHLDLGGYAKGWTAHQAMLRLSEFAPALVNAGGDIAISGPQRNGDPWLIGIENPLNPEENVAMVNLAKGGIATSGKDYRHWMKGGKLQHHLIDPWTGLPAVSDVFSATVIAPDVMLAEAAAKVAVIAGSGAGREWLDSQDSLAYFLQMENGQILSSFSFEQYLWKSLEKTFQQRT
ncbi:MAG TPA: FAD:protein FMN transferase [Anaerolineaceae bacterium]|jgi:thiamine biosynthesis lipoprotein|nr:FAD:protein FMN transferase [Anaerolineaceae bacterium]